VAPGRRRPQARRSRRRLRVPAARAEGLAWSRLERWVGRQGHGPGRELTCEDAQRAKAVQGATLGQLGGYPASELTPALEVFLREAEACRRLGLAREAQATGGPDAAGRWWDEATSFDRPLARLEADLGRAARRLEGLRDEARAWPG
jgi:hypothetical protein